MCIMLFSRRNIFANVVQSDSLTCFADSMGVVEENFGWNVIESVDWFGEN